MSSLPPDPFDNFSNGWKLRQVPMRTATTATFEGYDGEHMELPVGTYVIVETEFLEATTYANQKYVVPAKAAFSTVDGAFNVEQIETTLILPARA